MDKIDSQSVKYSVSASDHTTYLDIPGMTGISGPAESKNPSVFCSVCVILHIRQVMDRLYSAAPDGYCGDEDNGQTSAWYVFSALGFYPVCLRPTLMPSALRTSLRCRSIWRTARLSGSWRRIAGMAAEMAAEKSARKVKG